MLVEKISIIEEVEVLRLEVRMLREEVARLWVVERKGKEEQRRRGSIQEEQGRRGSIQEEQSTANKSALRVSVLPFPHPSVALSAKTITTLEPIVLNYRISAENNDKVSEVVSSKSATSPEDHMQISTKELIKVKGTPNILAHTKAQVLQQVKVSSRVHCDHCDKTYTTENRLRKHVESVHKDLVSEQSNLPSSTSSYKKEALTKLFECPLCDWKGATAGVVKTHVKKKHM